MWGNCLSGHCKKWSGFNLYFPSFLVLSIAPLFPPLPPFLSPPYLLPSLPSSPLLFPPLPRSLPPLLPSFPSPPLSSLTKLSYVETCQSVLIDVYDELMWPLPPALGGNDVSVSFPEAKTLAAAEETQDTELSHDSHMTDMSPLKEYGAPRAPASTGRCLTALPMH